MTTPLAGVADGRPSLFDVFTLHHSGDGLEHAEAGDPAMLALPDGGHRAIVVHRDTIRRRVAAFLDRLPTNDPR